MDIKVFEDLEQGTQEWHNARAALPTASEADVFLVNGKGAGGLGTGAVSYAYKVAASIILGRSLESGFENQHTRRGHAFEQEWLDNYAFMSDVDCQRVGFVRRNDIRMGCSPDALVGEDGGAEVKSPEHPKVIRFLLDPAFPKEYRGQCLSFLLVTGRQWVDLVIGAEGLPLCVRRLSRHDEGIQDELDKLQERVAAFNELVDDIVARVRALGLSEYEAAGKLFEQAEQVAAE